MQVRLAQRDGLEAADVPLYSIGRLDSDTSGIVVFARNQVAAQRLWQQRMDGRFKGKGVPSLRNKNVRGDHYVTLVVQVPTKLNDAAKQALKEFDMETDNSLGRSEEKKTEKAEKGKKKGFMNKLKETFEDLDGQNEK